MRAQAARLPLPTTANSKMSTMSMAMRMVERGDNTNDGAESKEISLDVKLSDKRSAWCIPLMLSTSLHVVQPWLFLPLSPFNRKFLVPDLIEKIEQRSELTQQPCRRHPVRWLADLFDRARLVGDEKTVTD